jgi:Lysozyme like domain
VNLAQLRALAVSTGFEDPDTAAAIAMAESGGNPLAQGDPPGPADATPNGTSTSFGLWQVHVPAHPEYDPQSLLDPNYNAKAALAISSGGTVWKWWSTFNPDPVTGVPAYLQYLPAVHLARVAPTLKLIAGVAAVSWVAAGIIRHGGIANAWHAAGRSLRRYV